MSRGTTGYRGQTRRTGGSPEGRYAAGYTYGSAAPKLVGDSAARRQRREQEERERRLNERRMERSAVRKNRNRMLGMDAPYLITLTIALIASFAICCSYIRIQSSISSSLRTIEAQEKTLERLKSENDARQTAINTNIDLDHIYQVATQELGMVYADRRQVIRYQKTESEYVRQYEDIPGDAAR